MFVEFRHGFVPVFESKKIFDTEVTFLAIELWSYNANYQTFSSPQLIAELCKELGEKLTSLVDSLWGSMEHAKTCYFQAS